LPSSAARVEISPGMRAVCPTKLETRRATLCSVANIQWIESLPYATVDRFCAANGCRGAITDRSPVLPPPSLWLDSLYR
jgi:hypothetical protein